MTQNAQQRRGRAASPIQIRASAQTKAMLVQAASLRGQKLSEFMLESVRRRAEETMLDQRAFFVGPAAHAKFIAMLDAAPKPGRELRTRMRRKPSWGR